MKLFIVLVALCALVACMTEATPWGWHRLQRQQLAAQQQQQKPGQAPLQLIQKRSWTKTKTKSKSKWTAMRRQSEEGLIGKID